MVVFQERKLCYVCGFQGFGCGAGTPRHLEGSYKQKTLNYPAVRNIVLGFYKVFSGLINAHNTEVV